MEKLKKYLDSFNLESEIIIVDDGSNDQTVEIAKSFATAFSDYRIIQQLKNQGKGAAVKRGFQEATGEIVVFTDADFSTPIEELPKLLEKINQGYDIAIGSRGLDRSTIKKHQNYFREMMGRSFNLLVRIIAVSGIYDTQCGFKAFKKATTADIFEKQTIAGFGFDVELLFLARRKGLKIAEVPVDWYNDNRSSVHPLVDSLKSFYDLLKIRFNHLGGR